MSRITLVNLSSGGMLVLNGASLDSFNLKYDLAWDSTDVIGRMNGIKNYKNTTKTRSLEIIGIANTSFFYTPQSSDSIPRSLEKAKENIASLEKGEALTNFYNENLSKLFNSGQTIESLFYPSYINSRETISLPGNAGEQKNNYFMQSAPLFYIKVKNEESNFTSICIIKNFNFNSAGKDIGSKKLIDKFKLSFELEEIKTDISQVSSFVTYK